MPKQVQCIFITLSLILAADLNILKTVFILKESKSSQGLGNKAFISGDLKLKFQARKRGGVGRWGGEGKGMLWTRCIRNKNRTLEIKEQRNLSQGKMETDTREQVTPHLESRVSQPENLNK